MSTAALRWSTFAAPSRFYRLADALNPWLWGSAIVLALAGLYIGFFVAPVGASARASIDAMRALSIQPIAAQNAIAT